MARLWLPLATFAALATLVRAGVEFTSPKAGAKIAGGTAIEVEWKDGGDGPALSDLTTYELFLWAGGNDADSMYQVIPITTAGLFTAGNKASGMVGIAAGASTPTNAYFLKMVATGKTGGTLTTYSSRFSMTGMTGVFPPEVVTGAQGISGTAGPDTVDETVASNPNANPAAEGDYGVEYTMQTGLTRYAPMQPVPPTKITKKNAEPLHPTSSVQIAKSILPIPKVQTTITQSQTFSVSSMENTVAAAPMPSDDMAKFLARWKD